MGLLEAAALLVTHGADLEARDGQGRTALWHAVREEEDGIVEMLIHAGAKVYYENEDLSCPTQLACKTALLKVLESRPKVQTFQERIVPNRNFQHVEFLRRSIVSRSHEGCVICGKCCA